MFLNRQKKEAINIMRDFAEGKILTVDFWNIYKQNITMQRLLKDDKFRSKKEFIAGSKRESFMPINADNALSTINISCLDDRVALFMIVKRYFWYREKIMFRNQDMEYRKNLDKLVPQWVGNVDADFLIGLISSIPTNSNNYLKLCKDKILNNFICENNIPKWLQEPEWPIINGTPCIFSHQEANDEGYERYFFYDPNERSKQIIIEQYE